MSTKIKDQSSSYGPHLLENLDNGWVNLETFRPGHQVTATMPHADFLAAVEAECGVRLVPGDAIVIDRAELPKVCVDTSGLPCIPGVTPEIRTQSAEKARFLAACWLALAEYLDAHPPTPPVDEADVETLAQILRDTGVGIEPDSGARRLLATGRVSVTR